MLVYLSDFTALLGPFEPAPHVAVAVSGGADSLALALLADGWARARGGRVTALVVDHGLRAASAGEAEITVRRLGSRGISARVLTLCGLDHGPGMAARARVARHAVLAAACAEAGIVHLLFGHHAGDQAETVAMRLLGRSGPAGLAGMAALRETAGVRMLRPLLAVAPGCLRATVRAAGLDWIEDPSNADRAASRSRLRALRADPEGTGLATRGAVAAARLRGRARAAEEGRTAAVLAERVALYPEGYAVIRATSLPAPALAALLRVIGGSAWAPGRAQLEPIAHALRPATLGGVRILPAGRMAPGFWLVVREAAALAGPVAAREGAVWDGRFRLVSSLSEAAGTTVGALGADAAGLRRLSALPAAVLGTLPALRVAGRLFAVPHLRYPDGAMEPSDVVLFEPPEPAAAGPFVPA